MTEDRDAGESFGLGTGLRVCNGRLEGGGGTVAFTSFRYDEAQGDQGVRICEGQEVVPVALVETSKGREDQHFFLVANRIDGRCEIVEMVVDHWRGCFWPIRGGG